MGIYGINIPIENPDDYIRETIEIFTIPTFSQFQPYYTHLHVSTDDLQKDPTNYFGGRDSVDRTAYLLPEFKNQKLMFVENVKYDNSGTLNYDGVAGYALGGLLPYNNSSLMQQMMLGNATSKLYDQMYPKLTWDFEEPNRLVIYNKIVSNSLDITLAFQHQKNLATIPKTAEESFFKLALCDCEINFYELAKHWDNMETALGNINLKIENWQDAESRRQAIIDEWSGTYHFDLPDSVVYK